MDELNGNNPQQEDTNMSGEQQNPVQDDPYAQSTYTQPDPYMYAQPEPKPKQGMAIAALVLGILSIVLFCIPFLPVLLAIVALILGIIPLVKKSGGKGLAIAGVICGAIGLIYGVYSAISVILLISDPNFGNVWSSLLEQYQ